MTKTIVLVGAGQHQLPALTYAAEHGIRVIALDGDADAPGLNLADEAHVTDIRDPEACLRVAASCPVDGVLALATEAGVRSAAFVAEQLGLPGLSYGAACAATDKAIMREAFARHGVASTGFRSCRSLEEARLAYDELGPRAVVKPSNSAGSRGVSYVDASTGLETAFDSAASVAGDAPVVVETFMEGVEVAVDGFVVGETFHGLCVSEKVRTRPPYLLDLSVTFPSQRPVPELEAILGLARKAAVALEIRDAPIHAEIMMTVDGPRMVEIAARGAGFNVFTKILPWVTGVDTVAAQFALCFGEQPDVGPRALKAAILDFPAFAPGRVAEIGGMTELAARKDLLFYEVFRRVGDIIGPLRSGADRAAAICARGESIAQVRDTIAQVMRQLIIRTELASQS